MTTTSVFDPDALPAHSPLGPSQAHRYLHCVGAPNAERGLPDDAGFEAAQGTVFHEYADMALTFGLEPHHFTVGTAHHVNGYDVIFDQEMVDKMYGGLDWVHEHMEEGDILFVETKVDLSPWLGPGEFGTADVTIIQVRRRRIICFDWKYGGIPVYPTKNEQAMEYVLGCWNTFAKNYFDSPNGIEVLIHIEQPRAPGGGGDWPTTLNEVLAWGEDVKVLAAATKDPNAPRTPGTKQCQFCKARKTCGAKAKWEFDMLGQQFSDADVMIQTFEETGVLVPATMPPLADITPEQRSFILLNWDGFKRWRDSLHEAALADAAAGRPVPLMKVVDGRSGNREFIPAKLLAAKAKAEKLLGDKAYTTPELLSPAALEAKLGKKKFREEFGDEVDDPDKPGKKKVIPWITQEPPGQSLVPVTDKREARVAMPDKFTDDDV